MRPAQRFDLSIISAAPFALSIILGAATVLFVRAESTWLGVVLLASAGLSLVLFLRRANRLLLAAVLICFYLLAWWRADLQLGRELRWDVHRFAQTDSVAVVSGRVCVPAEESRDSGYLLLDRVTVARGGAEIHLEPLRVRLFSDSLAELDLRFGDLVTASGSFRSSSERSALFSGALNGLLVRREAGELFAEPQDVFALRAGGYFVTRGVDRARQWIKECFSAHLSPDAASLCRALVLGDRQDFGYHFQDQLRITGLSHIFALSGLNTGLILSLLWVFLGLFFLPKTARYWLLLIAALLYMELGREVPSLVRATLMCSFFLIGRLLQRRAHVLNYVAAALAVELLWRPLDLIDPGFALSYLAVLGMVGGFQVIRHSVIRLIGEDPIGFRRSVIDVTAGTLTAQIGTYPLVAYLFQRIPLLGIFGNLLVVPGFAILLALACLLLLLGLISRTLAALLAPAIEWLGIGLAVVVDFFGNIPLSGLPVPEMPFWFMALLYAGITAAMIALLGGRKQQAAVYLLLTGCAIVWSLGSGAASKTRLSFIDVGNGDAILIEAGGRSVLIDAGPRYGEWSAARRILPYFTDQGIAELDALILTHPDTDHMGGAAELLSRCKVDRIYVNGDSSESRAYLELALAITDYAIPVTRLSAGEIMRITDSTRLTVLSPDSNLMNTSSVSNQKSLVIRLDTGSSSALLTADADSSVEMSLLAWGEQIDADLLRVGHHGSSSSSCVEFLKACSPDLCIITAGRRNPYHHPSPHVLERMQELHLDYLVTGETSSLRFEATDSGWHRLQPRAQALASLWKLPYG